MIGFFITICDLKLWFQSLLYERGASFVSVMFDVIILCLMHYVFRKTEFHCYTVHHHYRRCAAAQKVDHGLQGNGHDVSMFVFAQDGGEINHFVPTRIPKGDDMRRISSPLGTCPIGESA